MAGVKYERQETGFVNAIKTAFIQAGKVPISVKAGSIVIKNVIDANKYEGRQQGGSEPYTDVQLIVKQGMGKRVVNLSLKGDEGAPSLAGGGLKGMEQVIPGISKKYMKKVHEHLLKKMKLKPGSKVPDVYGKLNESMKLKLVVGTAAMGGPIHYMYIGAMSPKASFNKANKELVFENGKLIPSKTFARTHDLYFRLRARREDQTFDPSAKSNDGTPKVYGVSPSRGDSAGRIVVTDRKPVNAVTITIS